MKGLKFWKKIVLIASCLALVVSAPMSAYAASLSDSSFTIRANDSLSYPQVYPVVPLNARFDTSLSGTTKGAYSGTVTVNYFLYSTVSDYASYDGFFYLNNSVSVYFRPASSSVFDNVIGVSVSDASIIDSSGAVFRGLMTAVPYTSYESSFPASNDYDVAFDIPVPLSVYFNFFDMYIARSCILQVTYSVYSGRPLTRFSLNGVSLSTVRGTYDGGILRSDSLQLDKVNQNLDSLESKTDTTNNKLQNLTDGFSSSAIDNTNQNLGNQLNSFDSSEDAILSNVTDYFGKVEHPIGFFNAGAFLTSTSFVWTWLQGVYEKLGDAKIVVNVVLALTIAFSFIGLGRYIWRIADREDSS